LNIYKPSKPLTVKWEVDSQRTT